MGFSAAVSASEITKRDYKKIHVAYMLATARQNMPVICSFSEKVNPLLCVSALVSALLTIARFNRCGCCWRCWSFFH